MRTPHTAVVQRRVSSVTAHGRQLTNEGAPVPVACRFRRVGSTERLWDGVIVDYDAYLLTPQEWPGGPADNKSLVKIGGVSYDMSGVPIRRDGSARTAHWQINLKLVGGGDG